MAKKPELLSPAGSVAAFDAAIEAGADAIYLGLPSFNARINAQNFTPADIGAAISRAHAYGVKVYITLNTLVYDKEIPDFLRTAEVAYLSGADAVIVADLGGASLLRRHIPELELHASTQMSGHNSLAAKELQKLGFSRMVCAREMSEGDLRNFVKESPIEAEVFVHGALCVCHSGQCLFSSLVGGRSGNRGECAQPCRLPYGKSGNTYPLSLKDLSLAAHVDKLMDMGIASFKIEGRMKSPEYVRDVTRIWRRLIDEHRGANTAEMRELAEIFSRGGLTDGYYKKEINTKMLGVRSEGDKKNSRELDPFRTITRKIPVQLEARISSGEPASLTVKPYGVTAYGTVPEKAINAPLDKAAVIKNLSKLGATPYEATNINVELDDGLILPISAINALRRDAISLIAEKSGDGKKVRSEKDILPTDVQKAKKAPIQKRSAVFYDPAEIPDSAYSFFDVIYTPLHLYNGNTNGVLIPSVIYDDDAAEIRKMLQRARSLGAGEALVGNIGHLALVNEAGLTPHADYRLNISNNATAHKIEELGFEDAVLSPELTLPRIRDISGARYAVVYGKVPLMTVEKCVMREISDCDRCKKNGWGYLTDRKGVRFAVRREWEHRNIIFNSVPFYMADKKDLLAKYRITAEHFIFTDETADDADKVITAYKKGLAPTAKQVRRINV